MKTKTFQGRIEEVIADLGTQQAVVEASGASRSVVSQWKKGLIQSIAPEYAFALQRNKGYSAEWLMLGAGKKMLSDTTLAAAIRAEKEIDANELLERALRVLVIVGSDKEEVINLVKAKAAKSAEIQAAMRELGKKVSQ